MKSVELFSGCGGLALGLSRAGFSHEFMVEWNFEAIETLKLNKARGLAHLAEWEFHRADVSTVDWTSFNGRVDLVAGGPPCQPFSIGGKHRGHSDVRDMWPEAVRAVREVEPSAFLFENVKGLARASFADYLEWIVESLKRPHIVRKAGETHLRHLSRLRREKSRFDVLVVPVNAADFGAPQRRNRIIIAGVDRELGIDFKPPTRTHSKARLEYDQEVTGEYWRRHRIKNAHAAKSSLGIAPMDLPWVTVRDALRGLGSPNGRANHVFQDGARVYVGHTGSPLDLPAKALKAGDHGVPGGENMMVRDDGSVRYFTVREAARLQGLPDEFQFNSAWSESMRQLGNAVPVQLSEALGHWLAMTLNAERADTAA
jgi:DNA (cytosine-5)-methyltransferase 1